MSKSRPKIIDYARTPQLQRRHPVLGLFIGTMCGIVLDVVRLQFEGDGVKLFFAFFPFSILLSYIVAIEARPGEWFLLVVQFMAPVLQWSVYGWFLGRQDGWNARLVSLRRVVISHFIAVLVNVGLWMLR